MSKPGEPFLQCAIKNINGEMSNFVHSELKDGSVINVSPPFGMLSGEPKDSVLISAGIGITTMIALQNQLGSKVKKIIHVDKDVSRHAFRDVQLGANCDTKFYYSSDNKRPSLADISKEIAMENKNANVYMCGPELFMKELKHHLNNNEIKNVF